MKITELKGIGEKYAQLLGRLSVYTVEDLVGLYPRDYELYQEPAFISTLSPDYENTNVVIDGVVSKKIDVYHTGKLAVISTFINDETLPYKQKRILQVNDIVQFADARFRFC